MSGKAAWATFLAVFLVLAPPAKGQGGPPSGTAGGGVLHVDPTIAPASSTTYDPAARKCGAGTASAYRSLAGAAAAAGPGQTVLIREGTYAEPLIPRRSGLPGRPITFRPFGKEKPVISKPEMRPAINISGRSHLVLDGLRIDNVRHWLYAIGSHHNIIRNCRFARALHAGGSSKTGLFFQQATFNQVLNCTIEESTQDNLSLIRSDRNLIEGNTFRKARHTLWAIKGGNFNVVRGNSFHNAWQKIGEIYDCDRVGFDHEFTLSDCTKYNLVEGNTFAYTPSSGRRSPFAGIQYCAQNGIIRRNVFHSTVGPALDLTLYGGEATVNTDNRVYHNVFHGTAFAGMGLSSPGRYAFSGNLITNNIFAESFFVANDSRWGWYTRELAGKPVQVMLSGTKGFRFENNAFFASKGDTRYLIALGRRNSSANPKPQGLAGWQKEHPDLFGGNVQADPKFTAPAKHDFRLQRGSPMIDAGAFLTRTRSAGRGTSLPVEDVGWFFDVFDITGQTGDVIQLEGPDGQVTRVVDIDYKAKVLRLGSELNWSTGQGVALRYSGRRPDIGAVEFAPAAGKVP